MSHTSLKNHWVLSGALSAIAIIVSISLAYLMFHIRKKPFNEPQHFEWDAGDVYLARNYRLAHSIDFSNHHQLIHNLYSWLRKGLRHESSDSQSSSAARA